MRRKNIFMSTLLALSLCGTTIQAGQQEETNASSEPSAEYTVAAYIWPSCHDDPMGREVLWPEGTGEWEIIKKGNPRFAGHYQPKLPLWGYELDNDPKVMERWIDTATAYGVNTFIFDWYWFNNGPFLEGCLNDGFLKAKNNRKMNFYIMWADHDVARNYWNVHRYKEDDSRLWDGAIDWPNFKIVVERVIRQYFKQPNYFKIDGEPVFSVFSVENLIKTFGSLEETRKGLDYFREEVKKAGFPGLHIHGQRLPLGNEGHRPSRKHGSKSVPANTQRLPRQSGSFGFVGLFALSGGPFLLAHRRKTCCALPPGRCSNCLPVDKESQTAVRCVRQRGAGPLEQEFLRFKAVPAGKRKFGPAGDCPAANAHFPPLLRAGRVYLLQYRYG